MTMAASVAELRAIAEEQVDTENDGRRTIAERAADPQEPIQEEFPLGVLEGAGEVSLGNLVQPGEGVEVTASMMSAEVPLRGGLVDPRKEGKVVVSYEAARYIPVPQREGEPGSKQLVGWKVRCQLRPTYVEPASAYYTEEQVYRIIESLGVTRSADRIRELMDAVQV